MRKYIPSEIEPKWQKKWQEDKLYAVDLEKAKKPYYLLVEFPYSSGDLHIGHWFAFGVTDIFGRLKRMQGYDVFFPVGFDAFGLPAENAAIKRGLHPQDWTLSNVAAMTKQFKMMGAINDWEHSVVTCMPEYYKWNQWIFLKMLERGIAYKGKTLSNWCPVDQTVLADENVEAGKCWRCGTEVVLKEVEQWFLKITEYADRLLWKAEGAEGSRSIDWPKSIKDGQNNWIGRSEGLILDFDGIKVFTTRPDTTDGATFLVLAPEHPKIQQLITKEQKQQAEAYIASVKDKTELKRKENKDKTGVFTGSFVKNPITGKEIPVWISDYILMGYGTGAIMAVPFADERDKEFAEKFDLPIIETSFKSVPVGEKRVNYHLHDWSISRQRYWGTPIPVINCPDCGIVPVPEKDLPVELPYEVDHQPQGKPPLATADAWMKVKCPKCGGDATREPETMDGFVDNSWYFYRYLSPHKQDGAFDLSLAKKWMPLNIYFGGAEHTLGHTMYSRFFTKFFHDLGIIDIDEYTQKRFNHGVILGPDGARMSKSKGNIINPDDQVKDYGTDAVRMYLAFIGPYDIVAPWNPGGINGVYHFLQRAWSLQEKLTDNSLQLTDEDLRIMHKTIKKVGQDIAGIKFNTAISALMEWLNYLSRKENLTQEEYKNFLLTLAPFAPHITEELWSQVEKLSANGSIHQQSWPEFDNKFLTQEEVKVVVQINGKVRDLLVIQSDIINDKEVVEKLAKESEKVHKFLNGKDVEKVVYIPGKIINLVISS